MDITDADMDELENLIPHKKAPLTHHELRIKRAAQHLLQNCCGVISSVSLIKKVHTAAANLLVEDCLLLYTDDLFKDCDDMDQEGYIKYVPDDVDFSFIGRICHYDIDPTSYFKTITLPKAKKSLLSANGIRILRSMKFYQNLLDSPLPESPSDTPPPPESSSNTPPPPPPPKSSSNTPPPPESFSNMYSENVTQSDREKTSSNTRSLCIMEPLTSTNNQLHSYHDTIHKSNPNSYITEDNLDNSNNKILINITNDSNNSEYHKKRSKKNYSSQTDNHYLIVQQHQTSIAINKSVMNWNLLREQMIGLTNTDNATCYINAVLQCLASTPPLLQWLSDQFDKLRTCKLSNQGKFCSICELTNVICSINPSLRNKNVESDYPSIPSANSIRSHVHLISSTFTIGNQQDAGEFLSFLFDHLITCLSSHLSMSSDLSSTSTIINEICSINLLSSLHCSSCLYTSYKQEIQNILFLEIKDLNNLVEALAHFVDQETMIGENAIECSNCGQRVKGNKRITIHEPSPILIIILKRFNIKSFDECEKLSHQVNYNELLDVSPHMTSHFTNCNKENQTIKSSNDYLYKLYAIINHIGDDPQSGHYTSYVRSTNNRWFLVDDSRYRCASPNEVFNNSDAYILFYGKAFHTPTNNNSSLQQQQLLTSLLTENDPVSYSSSTLNTIDIINSTSTNRSIMLGDEQLLSNNSLTNSITMTSFDDPNYYNNAQLKPKDTSSTVNLWENGVLNKEPLPGQTESSITVIYKSSNDRMEKKRKNTDTQCNKVTNARKSTSYTTCSASNDRSDESIAELSDGEETRKDSYEKLASVASGVSIETTFTKKLNPTHRITLKPAELIKISQLRQEDVKKRSDRKMKMVGLDPEPSLSSRTKQSQNGNIKNRDIIYDEPSKKKKNIKTCNKVNIDYFYVLLPHLKHYNPYCALCIRSRYFGTNISKPTSLLVKCMLKCNGRYCNFKCTVHVLNNGEVFVVSSHPEIIHEITERLSRPIRGSSREKIKEKFKSGGSVYRIHAQYNEQRTMKEKQGFNYDTTGKSKKVFKKIKAEACSESLLSPDVTRGILQLHDQLVDEINYEGIIIKGALQLVQLRPFCVVVFTEASVRLYDSLIDHPDSVLSWDATGGIIKNTESTSKQCLYYELTITHPNIVDEDSLVPLTFMMSESQSLLTITTWLTTFKECHKKVFPHKKDTFPRPAVLLSDRAQIFLQAGLRVFNDESYQDFLARAYRIVTNQAVKNDFLKTNIHACLSHFMLDIRKRVNKFLPAEIRELAMWSVALLVNTSTWIEMKENWRLICEVFLNHEANETINFKMNYSILLTHINQITNDPNLSASIKLSKQTLPEPTDPFEFDDDIENNNLDSSQLHSNGNIGTTRKKKRSRTSRANSFAANKSIIDEEKQLNQVDSNFKQDLQKIYNECYENSVKSNASSTSSSTNKTSKSIKLWFAYFNQYCMPTVAIWSNLLLGNLTRHGTSSIYAFNKLLLSTHDQRTNAISERRMSIVKRTQLGTQTYMRSDVVLQILTEDMQKMIENFAISYVASTSEDNNDQVHQQKLKELQENWKQKGRRGHGYYAKAPETSVMDNLKYSLIISSTSINDGVSIPHLPVVNWLNVTIGILISIKSIRESPHSSSIMTTPLLNEILNFINKWISSLNRIKPPRKTSTEQMQLLNTQFHTPTDIPTDSGGQLNFVVHNILLRILDCSIPAVKIYRCISCKFTIHIQCKINYIPINIVEGEFQLRYQLKNYFSGYMSDHVCDKCSMNMSRDIKLLDCPPVIILSVNHVNVNPSSTALHKPPNVLCFQSFLEKSNIGCSSSNIYDIVAFISINPIKNDKLVLATKIKQRWCISSKTKLVGTGTQLCGLFSHSRLVILERIRSCGCSFIHAIGQSCSININEIEENDIKICKTLRDAVKTIENNPLLASLDHLLSAKFTTFYQCQKCLCSPSSLSTTHKCISIYEPHTEHSPICAIPLTWEDTIDLHCSVCNERTENIILPINKQIYYKCPSMLMYHLSRTTLHAVKDLRIELTDHSVQCQYIYQPVSVLLIDQYNTLSVIKLQQLLVYNSSPYQTAITLSSDIINELFHTAQTTIIFFRYVENDETTDYHSHADVQNVNDQQTICEKSTIETISSHQPHAPATSTPFLLKSPLPVCVFNTASGRSIRGSVRSFTISQNLSYNPCEKD